MYIVLYVSRLLCIAYCCAGVLAQWNNNNNSEVLFLSLVKHNEFMLRDGNTNSCYTYTDQTNRLSIETLKFSI